MLFIYGEWIFSPNILTTLDFEKRFFGPHDVKSEMINSRKQPNFYIQHESFITECRWCHLCDLQESFHILSSPLVGVAIKFNQVLHKCYDPISIYSSMKCLSLQCRSEKQLIFKWKEWNENAKFHFTIARKVRRFIAIKNVENIIFNVLWQRPFYSRITNRLSKKFVTAHITLILHKSDGMALWNKSKIKNKIF